MQLEINHKDTKKHAKTRKLNNTLLNNEWVNNEIKEEIKTHFETNENEENNNLKSVAHRESSPKRDFHSIIGLSQKTRKSSNKQSNFTPKGIWKRTTSPQWEGRK